MSVLENAHVSARILVGFREGFGREIHSVVQAEDICHDYTLRQPGLITLVTATSYVFKKVKEPGCVVDLLGDPRTPLTNEEIRRHATALAAVLRHRMSQPRVYVVFADTIQVIGDL